MLKTSPLFFAIALSSSVLAFTGCVELGGDDDPASENLEGALCTPTKLTPTTAVSSPSPKQAATKAIDNNTGTRWESAFTDPEWIYVDLGAKKAFTEVKIDWQHAAAKDYRIDTSDDAVNWSAAIATKTGGLPVDHRIDDFTGLTGNARYIRVFGTARATVYGYSIWELSVYNAATCGTAGAGGGGAGGGGSGGGGAAGAGTAGAGSAGAGGTCQSNNLTTSTTMPVTVSSVTGTNTGALVVDNNLTTRWESAYSDPQWIYLDLGATKTVNRVKIEWKRASAKSYNLDVSTNGTSWTTVLTKAGMMAVDHRIDDLTGFSVQARYVRMFGVSRAYLPYGYSIYEFDVFGDNSTTCSGGVTNLLTTGWDHTNVQANFTPVAGYAFGSNVNAISFDYRNMTFSTLAPPPPPLIRFTQTVHVASAGTRWRLVLNVSGMNNQSAYPPKLKAELNGFLPDTFAPGSENINVGQIRTFVVLSSGSTATMEFPASLSPGDYSLVLDDLPGMTFSADNKTGTGQQAFNITSATLTKVQ